MVSHDGVAGGMALNFQKVWLQRVIVVSYNCTNAEINFSYLKV
jgi:hypothetical protein